MTFVVSVVGLLLVAQGEEWAEEKLDEGREWIKGAMMLWQLTPVLAGAKG